MLFTQRSWLSSPVSRSDVRPASKATGTQLVEKVVQPAFKTAKTAPHTGRKLKFFDIMEELYHCSWYWGPMSPGEAEEVLSKCSDGSFLLRDSTNRLALFSLSFKSAGKTRNVRIENFDGGHGKLNFSILNGTKFDSVVQLVEHLRTQSQDLIPVSRNGTNNPPSLQHFCRFVIRLHTSRYQLQMLPLPRTLVRYVAEDNFFRYQGPEYQNRQES